MLREGGREEGRENTQLHTHLPGATALLHGGRGEGGVADAVTGGVDVGVGGLVEGVDVQQASFVGGEPCCVQVQSIGVLFVFMSRKEERK